MRHGGPGSSSRGAGSFRRSFLGPRVDGGEIWVVGAEAAVFSVHRGVDAGVRWLGFLLKQRRGGHDLAGLAVAAVGHAEADPRRLHRLAHLVPADRLDGGDLSLRRSRDRRDAGARGSAIEVDGTGAAQRHAATELGPGHSEDIAQHPQKRRLRRHVHLLRFAIHVKRYHVTLPGSETSWTSVEPELTRRSSGGALPRPPARALEVDLIPTYSVAVTVASNGAALISSSPPLW